MDETTVNLEKAISSKKSLHYFIGKRHLQALLMFLGMLFNDASQTCASVAVIAMTDPESAAAGFEQFDWDIRKISVILSSHTWGLAATQIPCGCIATKFSARKLVTFGILVSGVLHSTVPLTAYYGGWIVVVASRVLFGICQSCYMPGTQTLLSKWSPPFERSRLAMFIYNGSQLGTVLAMSVSGLLAKSRFGWPSIFYVFGGALITWSVLFFYLTADSPSEHPTISKAERSYIENSLGKSDKNADVKRIKIPWKAILTSIPVWAMIIASIGLNFGSNMLSTELPSYMKNILHEDLQESGILSALPYVCAWLMTFPLGWITDKCLNKGFPVNVVRKFANSVAFCGPALALIILCVLKTRNEVIVVGLMTAAVGLNTAIYCGYHVAHMEVSPNFAGVLMSMSNLFGNLSALMAPLLCGMIVTNLTDQSQWDIVFYVTSFVFVITNFVFLIFGTSKTQSWNEKNTASLDFSEVAVT